MSGLQAKKPYTLSANPRHPVVGFAEYIRRGIEKHPEYSKLLGGKDIKIKKFWLDIIYPNIPPPKHYVSGFVLSFCTCGNSLG